MAGVATVTVISEGKKVNSAYRLLSLEVNQQINKISSAELVYFDSEGYLGNFKISEDEVFKPGNTIKVQVRYEGSGKADHTIFEGIIVRHKIKLEKKGGLLILELRHNAIKLTASRNNIIYLNKTDKDIFSQIGKNYSGVKFSFKIKGAIKHPQMIQYNCSDWDFILARAEANGWWIMANAGDLILTDPYPLASPKYVFDLSAGSKIYGMDIGIDILHQAAAVKATTWKIDDQSLITETIKAEQGVNFGLQVNPFKKAVKGSDYKLSHIGALTKEELKAWAQAKLAKNDYSLLRGRFKTDGIPQIISGTVIELKSLTKYFNGKHIASSVRHLIDSNGFQTEISLGMPNIGFISTEEIQSPLAGGLLPAVGGLQIGVVEAYEEDKEAKLLVKVRLPLFEGKDKSIKARLASIYAGNERGVVFRPETGDEVVLGFFNDDPRYPVVLGSMYSAKNKPPIEFDKENKIKTIVTKGKLTLSFDDKTKTITTQTEEDSKISITSGDKPGVDIQDKNKNTLNLSDQGIKTVSGKDLILEAKGDTNIKSNGGIKTVSGKDLILEAKGSTNIKGSKVEIKGSKVEIK